MCLCGEMWLYKRALNYVREWGNKINMKRLVFVLGLCVCMAYGDEYDKYNKQKAEFMSKNFERKLKELVKESGLKSESAKLLYQAAIVPALYESGLKGNDANGGWSIYTISLNYKGSNGRYYFWNQYERLAQRVSEVCGANIGSEANGINESYTPAQQKCIKSLATLELEMNKDIFKWNLEQMKNKEDKENNGWKEGCDVDYTSIYQLTDTLWSNLQKEAKLGVFKDFNKPGMEQFYKGLLCLWVTDVVSGSYWKAFAFGSAWGSNKFKSISDFFEERDEELERNFSFLYDSVEVNQKKLQARLDAVPKDARQADECYKTYLSTKEYQEARAIGIQKNARAKELGYRMSRAGALEKDMFEKLARYVRDNAASYLTFDKCIGLSDKDKDDENEDTQDSKESLFSGRYAELFDEKYYEKKSDDWYGPKVKPEIYENALYKELTWCAIKDKYNDVSKEIDEYKSGLGAAVYGQYGQYAKDTERNATARRIVDVAKELFARKWKAMAEKYPYVDYESAIENPWYKDKAKRKTFDDDVNKNITSILENYKKEYEQCEKKIFEGGKEKCKTKLREKTLKKLQAKLK